MFPMKKKSTDTFPIIFISSPIAIIVTYKLIVITCWEPLAKADYSLEISSGWSLHVSTDESSSI